MRNLAKPTFYYSPTVGKLKKWGLIWKNFQDSELFFGTEFPNDSGDIPIVCDKLVRHATGDDDVRPQVEVQLPSLSLQDWYELHKTLQSVVQLCSAFSQTKPTQILAFLI